MADKGKSGRGSQGHPSPGKGGRNASGIDSDRQRNSGKEEERFREQTARKKKGKSK